MHNKEYYEYVGALHVHTKYSDGSGSIKKIIKSAKETGLDYVIISDHNNIKAKKDALEGWHNGVLLLVGEEIGIKRTEHYLAIGIDDPIVPDKDDDIRRSIEIVKLMGGFGFIAHPYGIKKKQFKLKIPQWDYWDDPNYDGIEIWSYMHDWSHNVNLFNIIYYYINPRKAIDGPPENILKKWDELCQKRRVVGIGVLDVHAKYLFPFFMFQFLSYKRAFRSIRTHILTPSKLNPNINESKSTVYNSLKEGNCFFADDYLADSKGFRFSANLDRKKLIMGEEYKMPEKAELLIETPSPSKIILIKDGKIFLEKNNSCFLTAEIGNSGVYRVEVKINDRPWIYSNPIYLREADSINDGKNVRIY